MEPPRSTVYTIKEGMTGWPVFALQRGLNGLKLFEAQPLVEDASFGPVTKAAVTTFQDLKLLVVDGVAGPHTQSVLAQSLAKPLTGLPEGLLLSIMDGESGRYLAAVNWSVPGGVDCGVVQRRVYGPPWDDVVTRRAFDTLYQLKLLRKSLISLHDIFLTRPAVDSSEWAWRLAVLNHNYPSAADKISRVGISGLSSYWTSRQTWVTNIGAKFPDGVVVETPLEWCQKYSLGNSTHNEPGMMVKGVTSWQV